MAQTLTLVLSIAAICVASAVVFIYRRSQYWKKRGIPTIGNVFFGDFTNNVLQKESFGDSMFNHYKKYKHLRYTGTFNFGHPVLLIHDPEIIKGVFVSEFSNFSGKGFCYDAEKDPLSANLLFMSGHDWKVMRTKLTPVFTSGKIKYMFSTVLEQILKLQGHLEKERGGKEYVTTDARELIARLATDVILSVTMGILANSVENPDAEFRKYGRLMFEPSLSQFGRVMAFAHMHKLVKLFNIKIAPKEVYDFFMNTIHDTIKFREKNNVKRNDFLDLMIQLKNYGTLHVADSERKSTGDNFLTENQIAAQAFLFFLAGFETTSSTISYALFEISKHPEVLRKIQAECDAALKACNGEITYETVQSLEYIEMAVQESQRLHPAAAVLGRATLQECTLPTTDVKLDKGTSILLSIYGLHRDPEHFPDPEKYDPERFSPENKDSIPHNVFVPFGNGPRSCIGMRFAMVQVKATILALLSKYDVALAEGTPKTIEYDPRNAIVPAPKFPLNMKFILRKK